MNKKREVIIIKSTDINDNDALLNAISETGKICFKARGVNKINSKNATSTALFNKSVFIYNDDVNRKIYSLRSGENINTYRHIRVDLMKSTIASLMCEVIDKIDIYNYKETYNLLDHSLEYLDKTDNPLVLLGLFIAKINEICGVSPVTDSCVKCGNTKGICSISLKDGGFICKDCFDFNENKTVSLSSLKFFRLFDKAGIDDFTVLETMKCSYEDIEPVLNFFREYSGVNIKSIKFLEKIVKL